MALDDPDSPWDAAIFVWLIFSTFLMGAIFFILILKRRTYAMIRYRNPGFLYGLVFFGILASWSAFVSNDHLSILDPLRSSIDCSFWSYWMSQTFGVNMWIVIMFQNLIDKTFIFNKRFFWLNYLQKTTIRVVSTGFLMVVPIILSANVTFQKLSKFSVETHSCESEMIVKLVLIVWYILCFFAFNMTFLSLESQIGDVNFSEYILYNHITGLAQYVFVTNICINLFGVVHYSYGRFLYTFNINLLFLITVLRICGYSIYKILINDTTYYVYESMRFISYDKIYLHIREIAHCQPLMELYYLYVTKRIEQEYSIPRPKGSSAQNVELNNDGKRFNLQFTNLSRCFTKIKQMFERKVSSNRVLLNKKSSIIAGFFKDESPFKLCFQNEELRKIETSWDFQKASKMILDKMNDSFYGTDFCKNLASFTINSMQEITKRNSENRTRMINEMAVDSLLTKSLPLLKENHLAPFLLQRSNDFDNDHSHLGDDVEMNEIVLDIDRIDDQDANNDDDDEYYEVDLSETGLSQSNHSNLQTFQKFKKQSKNRVVKQKNTVSRITTVNGSPNDDDDDDNEGSTRSYETEEEDNQIQNNDHNYVIPHRDHQTNKFLINTEIEDEKDAEQSRMNFLGFNWTGARNPWRRFVSFFQRIFTSTRQRL